MFTSFIISLLGTLFSSNNLVVNLPRVENKLQNSSLSRISFLRYLGIVMKMKGVRMQTIDIDKYLQFLMEIKHQCN